MNKIILTILFVLAVCLSTIAAYAHSGNTDSYGCHYNHKTGQYHCHKPKFPSFK